MTGNDLADIIGATPMGKKQRQWEAPCPVHGDDGCWLRIINGFKGVADVQCPRRCSIYKIIQGWGLRWKEFTARPAPPPDLSEMDDEEIAAHRAKHRDQQAKHGNVCQRLRRHRLALDRLRQELMAMPAECRPQKLVRKLKDALVELRGLQVEEGNLRAPGTCPAPCDPDADRVPAPMSVNLDEYTKKCKRARMLAEVAERRERRRALKS